METESTRLAAAIAEGGTLPSLLALLQERERRRTYLHAQLAELEREQVMAARERRDGHHALLDKLRGEVENWQGMLRQEVGPARQALRALVPGRLVFTPQEQQGERFYAFSGRGHGDPGPCGDHESATRVVAPTGFDGVTCLPPVDFAGFALP